MVDTIVSPLLELLISFATEEMKQKVQLVTGVKKEVDKLTGNLRVIEAVLDDAEERLVKDKAVRHWLGQLKCTSYDIEDVLDEWIIARRKLQIEGGVDDNALVASHKKKKVCFCFPTSCFGFKQVLLRHDIAVKIKEINEKLDDIATRKDRFKFLESGEKPGGVQSASFIDEEEICGRVSEKNELIRKLLCESSEQQKASISSQSLVWEV